MRNVVLFVVFLSIFLLGSVSVADEEGSFKVIIHASNPTEKLTKQEISKLFLKKIKRWENINETVLPIDLVDDSPVRAKFSKEIHGRKISSIKAYWQKQIFSGRGVPPEEKPSDEEVLEYVSEHSGAIGYISESTETNVYDVKVVEIAGE